MRFLSKMNLVEKEGGGNNHWVKTLAPRNPKRGWISEATYDVGVIADEDMSVVVCT